MDLKLLMITATATSSQTTRSARRCSAAVPSPLLGGRCENDEVVNISCPTVFFSSESSTYVPGFKDNIDLDNIAFKANLNNFAFSGNCFSDSTFNNYLLDLLILVEPINPENDSISLPIFVLLYDKKEQLIDKQFFRIKSSLEYNQQNSKYNITETIQSLNIILQNNKKAT